MAVFAPESATAQTVRGTVVGTGDVGVPGVVVQLMDSADAVVARALTNERGDFLLAGVRPGTVRVRTLRIGFRPTTSQPFVVRAGEDVTRRIVLSGIAFALDTVHVTDRAVCREADNASASSAFGVWDQARAALAATDLTLRSRSLAMTLLRYAQILDRTGDTVLNRASQILTDSSAQPWISLSADSLRRSGYIAAEGDSVVYRAPGLDVLVSNEFVADHCFRLVKSKTDTSRLGLEFESAHETKDVPDIKGTLWLDRATSELRALDFGYANTPLALQERLAGGSMQFARMPNGAWLITRWEVHMPTLAMRAQAMKGLRTIVRAPAVTDVRASGGELVMVRRGNDTLWVGRTLRVAGVVLDSLTGKPVVDARVALQGTQVDAAADSAGRFDFPPVPPGDYVLEVRSASLDSMRAVHRVPLSVMDSIPSLIVHAPDAQVIASALCGASPALATLPGIVLGSITSGALKTTIAEWSELDGGRSRWIETRSDSTGRFLMCGVPLGTDITVSASADSGAAAPVSVNLRNGARVARVQLAFDRSLAATAIFSGTVLLDSTMTPIADAEVALTDIGRSVRSSANGTFRINGIPAGAHDIAVRKLGYASIATQLQFAPNQRVQRRVVLGHVSVLEAVNVTATSNGPWVQAFEDRRKIGLGTFFTREDLAKYDGGQLRHALGTTRGLQVEPKKGQIILGGARKCPSFWYVDNYWLYDGKPTQRIPQLRDFPPESIEALEFYGSVAEVPAELSALNAICGVIVIHTRESP